MPLLTDAWKSLRRNRTPVGIYILCNTLLILILQLGNILLSKYVGNGPAPPWAAVFDILFDLLCVGAGSALQAVIFAEIGKEIDRPLWKCAGPRDALRRFFMVWFILNLIVLMIAHLQMGAAKADNAELLAMLMFFMLLFFPFYVPLGACAMYWGRLEWSELPEALRPIVRMVPGVLVVLGLGLLQWILPQLMTELTPPGLLRAAFFVPLDILLALLEVLAFAAMWRLCMQHRDTDFSNSGDFGI